MKQCVLSTLAVLLLLTGSNRAGAQEAEMKPIAVVAIKSYQNLIGDLEAVARAAHQQGERPEDVEADVRKFVPEVGKLLGAILQTDPIPLHDLKGIVRDKPLGLVVATDGVLVAPLVFMPVDDFPALLGSLSPLLGEAVAGEDGLYEVGSGITAGVAKEIDGWAYFAQLPDHLDEVPDPLVMVGDLVERYDLGCRLNVLNIPEAFRSFAVDLVRGMASNSGERLGLEQQMGQAPFELLQRVLSEAEEVTFGLTLDETEERITSETLIKPALGSRLASQAEAMRSVKTRFGGLKFDAPIVQMNFAAPLDADMVEHLTSAIDGYRVDLLAMLADPSTVGSEEEQAVLQDMVVQFTNELKSTVSGGHLDAALVVTGRRAPFTLAAATRTANGAAYESLFKQIVELAEADPGIAEAALNVGEHEGVALHRLKLANDPQLEAIRKNFGLDLLVAFGDDVAWLALGPDGETQLKQMMSSSQEAEIQPLKVEMGMANALRMLSQSIEDSNQRMALAVLALNLAAADDRAHFGLATLDDGTLRVNFEAGKGLVRTIAIALPLVSQLLSGGGIGGGAGNF